MKSRVNHPGCITDRQTSVRKKKDKKKERKLFSFFFSWNRLMRMRKRNSFLSLTGEGNIDLSFDKLAQSSFFFFPEILNTLHIKSGLITGCRAHSGSSWVHTEQCKTALCHPAKRHRKNLKSLVFMCAKQEPTIWSWGRSSASQYLPVLRFFCFLNKNLVLNSLLVWLFEDAGRWGALEATNSQDAVNRLKQKMSRSEFCHL